MNKKLLFLVAALAGLLPARAKDLQNLGVLYVGAERTAEYVPFLKENVGRVETRDRHTFKPADAAGFDVVLLDWPQRNNQEDLKNLHCPLGPRENWTKPTVLLGSAGLFVAVSWSLEGGIGCTCLSPEAYDLRDHEIFNSPLKIDRSKTTRIPTPLDFQDKIKASVIDVVMLVPDPAREGFPGWCSYSSTFEQDPEVEFFCGGVNHKTPTAAAVWRQGNLLHFGFEESPVELNLTGQKLLLNAIAYISKFSQDRPIAIKRSGFLGDVSRTRKLVLKDAETPQQFHTLALDLGQPLLAQVQAMTREQQAAWARANAKFLHPNPDYKMVVDDDLAAWGIPFDSPDFFDKAVAGLRAGGKEAERAARLLARYVHNGPKDGGADAWASYWQDNQPFLFASDEGEFHWYLDPLAKSRGIPTRDLRGPKRADPAPVTAAR
jgi:hypothetical protein